MAKTRCCIYNPDKSFTAAERIVLDKGYPYVSTTEWKKWDGIYEHKHSGATILYVLEGSIAIGRPAPRPGKGGWKRWVGAVGLQWISYGAGHEIFVAAGVAHERRPGPEESQEQGLDGRKYKEGCKYVEGYKSLDAVTAARWVRDGTLVKVAEGTPDALVCDALGPVCMGCNSWHGRLEIEELEEKVREALRREKESVTFVPGICYVAG